ncbi:rhomboid-related protein 1-like [Bradysia coprophila]|uniref:rhomboid-related protein 1-like n=1 Tax=Bradysia coprophila TaxID=38358 RepID=UPI00187D7CCB|nr:rhomboid-related protein 1-like [Bradysia coprophila]
MLAHNGQLHLLCNVIFQLIVGVLLEIVHGWKRIGIIYVSSVLGGSLFITVLSPQSYVVGASAGVYGLLFSHLSTIIINWNEMDRKCCRVFWLLAYVFYGIGRSVYVNVILNTQTNISHAGHFGGAITGFLVSIFVLKNFEKHPWEEKMQKVCVRVVVALAVIIIVINVTAWGLYAPTEFNFNYMDSYERYLFKKTVERPQDSKLRTICEENEHCKQLLDQLNYNGTISGT